MRSKIGFKHVILIFLTLLLACKKDKSFERYYGSPVPMGNGKAQSWIRNHNGVPQEIGIEITMQALFNMPNGHQEYILPLPATAKDVTPFEQITVNWNSHGHPPFFYEFPHFDFHFYTIGEQERNSIPAYSVNPAGFNLNPPAAFMPPTYIAPPGGEEAKMGKHWVDSTSPELPNNGGAPFTKTFIYGTYNGKVAFLEPMVTLDFLKNGKFSGTYPQPQMFQKRTYYPTKYNIYKSANSRQPTYIVSLSDFVLRN